MPYDYSAVVSAAIRYYQDTPYKEIEYIQRTMDIDGIPVVCRVYNFWPSSLVISAEHPELGRRSESYRPCAPLTKDSCIGSLKDHLRIVRAQKRLAHFLVHPNS